ncbi:DDE-type integrase/transposase/recombinase [Nocardia jinanensis]|uniref:DDE-type integrase/transposase/recombinase n=1 Tax=Nocardia jinanensis TaxID=382504 RepID=UPI0016645977|nr:DDE-type integrase/transposase/recombinase [Nocardia jinanensis]
MFSRLTLRIPHRWVSRFRAQGRAGLLDRSSRPRRLPSVTPPELAGEVLRLRQAERLGPAALALRTGVSASTASRLIARAGLPRLFELDPVTGVVIRASRRTQLRYEHPRPGDLLHIDVKKLGRIPEGGGWRLDGYDTINHRTDRRVRIGFDYVHVAVDDHSRLAFAQILPDEKGGTCAAFLNAAALFFAGHGVEVRRVMTDNALNYRRSREFQSTLSALNAKHIRTKPHCPWRNGKAERSTGHCRRTGPTVTRSPPTRPATTHSPHGWSTTTTLAHTPPAAAAPDHPTDTNVMTEYSRRSPGYRSEKAAHPVFDAPMAVCRVRKHGSAERIARTRSAPRRLDGRSSMAGDSGRPVSGSVRRASAGTAVVDVLAT